jgi:hypothetical protein
LESHKDILLKIEQLHIKDAEQDDKILLIFEFIKKLELSKKVEDNHQQRKRIGFKPDK